MKVILILCCSLSICYSQTKESINKEELKNQEWFNKILENSKEKNKKGFSLFYESFENFNIPYLIYIPSKHKENIPKKAVLFLHGGVVSTPEFQEKNYLVQNVPIFKIAEKLNFIVIYPFGKEDFGWVKQPESFTSIINIVKKTKDKLNLEDKNLFAGGMSNGGNAIFVLASKKNIFFQGFFAISASPIKIDQSWIDFSNLENKKIISLNAKNDNVYSYNEAYDFYKQKKIKNWDFKNVKKGGHGFIYKKGGKKILEKISKKSFKLILITTYNLTQDYKKIIKLYTFSKAFVINYYLD